MKPNIANTGEYEFIAPEEVVATRLDVAMQPQTTDRDVNIASEVSASLDPSADQQLDESDSPAADTELDLDKTAPAATADIVQVYLKQIGRRELLTAADEADLSKQIEAGLYASKLLSRSKETGFELDTDYRRDLQHVVRAGETAKNVLLESNLRLVVSIAKRYTGHGMAFSDLIQEGNIGLIRAVEKFDYTKGFKFSTYATWWIRQAITRGMADQSRTIRLPIHVVERLGKLGRARRELQSDLQREPTHEELAAGMDVTLDKVQALVKMNQNILSLDMQIGDDGDAVLLDFVADKLNTKSGAEADTTNMIAEDIERALSALTVREATIVAERFGIGGGEPKTLDEIGQGMDLSRERIRQIEKEAKAKMRLVLGGKALRDYFDA
ncbi:MAG: sigma-70 family RNA polymerase sigma factor [Candidatus Saccharimonadales bacterium]